MKNFIIGMSILASTMSYGETFNVENKMVKGSLYVDCFTGGGYDLSVGVKGLDITGVSQEGQSLTVNYNARIEGSLVKLGSSTIAQLSDADVAEVESLHKACPTTEGSYISSETELELRDNMQIEVKTHKDSYCDSNESSVYDSFLDFVGDRTLEEWKVLQVNGETVTIDTRKQGTQTCVSVRSVVDGVTATIATPFKFVGDIFKAIF